MVLHRLSIFGSPIATSASASRAYWSGECSGSSKAAAVGEHINGAVGTDANIWDPGAEIRQQGFFRNDLVVHDRQPVEQRAPQPSEKRLFFHCGNRLPV